MLNMAGNPLLTMVEHYGVVDHVYTRKYNLLMGKREKLLRLEALLNKA